MIKSSRQFAQELESTRKNSYFLQSIETALSSVGEGGPFTRKLTKDEIRTLEEHGNRADDWEDLRVSPDFTPERIFTSFFFGPCRIGFLSPEYRDPAAETHPPGIYNSIINNSVIGDNARIYGNSRLEFAYICEKASVFNSTIRGAGTAPLRESVKQERRRDSRPFGIGSPSHPGLETGGRKIRLNPDLTYETARFVLEHHGNDRTDGLYDDHVDQYLKSTDAFPYSYIDRNAHIESCVMVDDCWIGPEAVLSGVFDVSRTILVSTENNPVFLGPGVICRNSVIQGGTELDSGAFLENCGIFGFSHIDKHAKGSYSLLGPSITFSEGEITSSFAGPFTGSHHQALLISAYWPEGKGNVASGANVGSNHTSRMPDQEIRPGEGTFFGLNCTVKFPANFEDAPYSVISSGITTLPQRMQFPFSCIIPPEEGLKERPPGFNRLIPGWCLYKNMYMCIRGRYKYRDRNKGGWDEELLEIFNRKVMERVMRARTVLSSFLVLNEGYGCTGQGNKIVTDADLAELGKNYTRRTDLETALKWYDFILRYYYCDRIYVHLPAEKEKLVIGSKITLPDENDLLGEIGSTFFGGEMVMTTFAETYLSILETIRELTVNSREKDMIRGSAVIDDYEEVHLSLADDPVILRLDEEIEEVTKRFMDIR